MMVKLNENMTKGKAITLAAFTAWPFIVPAIGLLFEATGLIPSAAAEPPAAFVVFYALLCLTPIEVLALLIFYLGYLFTRPHLSLDWKLVWAVALVIGHVFIMPVFWYLHIWKPRYFAPMQASSRFSLLVFGPLFIVLLLPLAYLFPITFSMWLPLVPALIMLKPPRQHFNGPGLSDLSWVLLSSSSWAGCATFGLRGRVRVERHGSSCGLFSLSCHLR